MSIVLNGLFLVIGEVGQHPITQVQFKNPLQIQWEEHLVSTDQNILLVWEIIFIIMELKMKTTQCSKILLKMFTQDRGPTSVRLKGVTHLISVYRPRKAPNLQCPWYHTTGNHDWSTRVNDNGEIVGGNVTAQIAYTEKSDRWMFPDLFYKIDTYLPNGISQRVIMIDTPSLSGVYATRPIDMTEGSGPDQTCPGPYLSQIR